MMRGLIVLLALVLAGCTADKEAGGDGLDPIARDYVRMQLEIGERDPGYVDAYYGPAEWQAAAKAAPRSLDELGKAAAELTVRTDAVDPGSLDALQQRRRTSLLAQLKAASTRLRIVKGERLGFVDEAEGLFGVRPELKPLQSYDPLLARIEQLVPGAGALADRVDAFQARFDIPRDKLEAVMRAAIAECRRRTVAHIPLPANERFTLELVTGKSWSGYNWYKGAAASVIQINTDLPVRISRAVDLGCHEGYPGHHVLNMLLERDLVKKRGWVEYSVYPLYSPQSLIAEGSGNYGIELAFPGDDQLRFETSTLYPIAGLSTERAADYLALLDAMKGLAGARFTIAADFLEGRIDRPRAVELIRRYQLVSKARADQIVDFIEQYRSYTINYGLGLDMVRAHVEAAGPDQPRRWAAMKALVSEPVVPSELKGR